MIGSVVVPSLHGQIGIAVILPEWVVWLWSCAVVALVAAAIWQAWKGRK